jgi:TusA-related sulfurtransferase
MKDRNTKEDSPPDVALDLIGVACPLNWARAKARLETMRRGEVLELLTDDPRAGKDVPRAAEAEGYWVLDVEMEPGRVRIRIER